MSLIFTNGNSTWPLRYFLGTGLGGGQKGSLQRAAFMRTAGGGRMHSVHIAMISKGCMRYMTKPKKVLLRQWPDLSQKAQTRRNEKASFILQALSDSTA